LGRLVTPISKEEYDKLPLWRRRLIDYSLVIVLLFLCLLVCLILLVEYLNN
jgi:hypothetical protein